MISLLHGNGRVLLTLNEEGRWNDLFYPYPGQYQHLREMRLGLFQVDTARFDWLERGRGFDVRQSYAGSSDTGITTWRAPGLEVTARDHVHPNHDLVIRVVEIRSAEPRRLRLFAYHCLTIAESMYQNTAYFDPEAHSLVHYRGSYYFEFFGEPGFDRCVCGEHTLKGLKGTYVDAEDGKLEGGLISHGAADSILQWNLEVTPQAPALVRIFLALGPDAEATGRLRGYVRTGDSARFEREATAFSTHWIARHRPGVPDALEEEALALYLRSILVMRNNASANGAIIASPDTRSRVGGDTYNYCWWRDGGYISKTMDEVGLYDSAQRFLSFAMRSQAPQGCFLHRQLPDGTLGSTWHPPPFLQVDQTGTVIAAVWHHFKRQGEVDVLLTFWPMVKNAANFLARFRDPETGLPAASYDLWEERKGIHTYSTAVVIHALERAARIADELGKDSTPWRAASREMHEAALRHLWDDRQGILVRSLAPRDEKADASLLLALRFGLLEWSDPRARETVNRIERRLRVGGTGGVSRYEGDQYYGHENPWIITTLWLAEAKLNLGAWGAARDLIRWCVRQQTPTGLLPEQVDSAVGEPRSATPLVWSHSTFVEVANKYGEMVETAAGREP